MKGGPMVNWFRAHRNDILLIAVLLIIAGALALFLWSTREAGGYVSVTMDGEKIMELPLDVDTQVTIGEGEHTNLLVIQNGTARITSASCPDLLCVHQGAIQYAGQSIVCLPNKLVVTVERGSDGGFDAVAQ